MLPSTRHVRENRLGACLSSLVAQHNADLAGVGPDLLEGRIADDLADGTFVAEGPLALVAVREGNVRVGTALYDNGVTGVVQDLATVVLILDPGADDELHGLEGACGANGGCLLARTGGEDCLGAGFGGLVGEDYAEGGVGCGFGPGGGEGAGASQGSEEKRRVLHSDGDGVVNG